MGYDIGAHTIGITNVFLNDATLLAALGGTGDGVTQERLYDTKAIQNPTFPYAVFQFIGSVTERTFNTIVELADWQFSIFHQDLDSPLDKTTINSVFNKLTDAYDDAEATMTVAGYSVTWVTRTASFFLPTEDNTQQLTTTYSIRTEKAR